MISQKGAAYAFQHDCNEEVMKLTGGKGVDVIIEMLANQNLHSDLQVLANNGVVVVVGNRGRIEINPRDLMMKETRIVGMLGGHVYVIPEDFYKQSQVNLQYSLPYHAFMEYR